LTKEAKVENLIFYQHEFIKPLGLMTLSVFLKQAGQVCDFIDLTFEKDRLKKIRGIRCKPDDA